jgi:hypothetical protein
MIRHLYLSPTVTHRRYRDPGRFRVPHPNRGVLDYYARPHLRSQHPRGPAADPADLSHARLASLLRLEKVLVCAEDDARMLMPLQLDVRSARPRTPGHATCGTHLYLDRSERTARRAGARSISCRLPGNGPRRRYHCAARLLAVAGGDKILHMQAGGGRRQSNAPSIARECARLKERCVSFEESSTM